jgi:hypothetical protein
MNDDLIARLHDLASEPAPGPDPQFAAALEDRLRAAAGQLAQPAGPTRRPGTRRPVHAAGSPGSAGSPGPRRPVHAALRRPVLLAGLAAVAAAAVVAIMARPAGLAHPRVQLAAAIDTQVIGPDGRVGEAAPGAVIADGSIVRTGPSGQTRAGGVIIGPNLAALAVDGKLRTVTSELSRDRHNIGAGQGHAVGSLHLAVRRGAGADVLRWTPFTGHSIYGYVILVVDGNVVPDSNQDAVAFTTGTSSTQRSAGMVTYRVVAVDRQGRVLASSEPVTVGSS